MDPSSLVIASIIVIISKEDFAASMPPPTVLTSRHCKTTDDSTLEIMYSSPFAIVLESIILRKVLI